MAQTEEQTSTREGRVGGFVDRLTALTETAEASKDAPKPVADFTRALSKVTGHVDSMNGESAQVVEALIGSGHGEMWQETIGNLRTIIGALSTAPGGESDRVEGDSLAKKLAALIESDIIEDAKEVETFTALIERWRASAPKGSKRSGGSSTSSPDPDLGFTVKVHCQVQGCTWGGASTEKDNLNSIRRQAQVHAQKVHGQPMVSGQPLHNGITEALAKVGMNSTKFDVGEATAAEGGGFTVTRSA